MMSNEQFVERVFDNFDNINEKMDKHHESMDFKVSDLCNRMTKIESEFTAHLEVGKKIDEFDDKKLDRKEKKFYVIMALIGAGFTALNFLLGIEG